MPYIITAQYNTPSCSLQIGGQTSTFSATQVCNDSSLRTSSSNQKCILAQRKLSRAISPVSLVPDRLTSREYARPADYACDGRYPALRFPRRKLTCLRCQPDRKRSEQTHWRGGRCIRNLGSRSVPSVRYFLSSVRAAEGTILSPPNPSSRRELISRFHSPHLLLPLKWERKHRPSPSPLMR